MAMPELFDAAILEFLKNNRVEVVNAFILNNVISAVELFKKTSNYREPDQLLMFVAAFSKLNAAFRIQLMLLDLVDSTDIKEAMDLKIDNDTHSIIELMRKITNK